MTVLARALNRAPILIDDGLVGEKQEGGASVGDGITAAADGLAVDGERAGGETPEALGVVDGDVSDLSRVLRGIDGAEVVGARFAVLEAGGEKRRGEGGLDRVEEGGALVRGAGVNVTEGQAHEAVVLGVLSELAGDGGGGFDGLAGRGDVADHDGVGVDVARRTGLIAVGDLPRLAGDFLAGLGGVVLGLAVDLAAGELGGEHPEVGRAGVKVQRERLAADGDGAEVGLGKVSNRGVQKVTVLFTSSLARGVATTEPLAPVAPSIKSSGSADTSPPNLATALTILRA